MTSGLSSTFTYHTTLMTDMFVSIIMQRKFVAKKFVKRLMNIS